MSGVSTHFHGCYCGSRGEVVDRRDIDGSRVREVDVRHNGVVHVNVVTWNRGSVVTNREGWSWWQRNES